TPCPCYRSKTSWRRPTAVSDPSYTRRYFSDSARRWLATAYVDGTQPAGYPLGSSRVRLALTAAVDRLGSACGRLVDVGCGGGDLCFRTRLFTMASVNEYTRRECGGGGAVALLGDLAALPVWCDAPALLDDFVRRLKDALPELEAALAQDRAAGDEAPDRSAEFRGERRQHTPREIEAVARAAGFQQAGSVGLHPHPWPPAWERVAPRFYNRLASVYEALETAPASLMWSSSFVAAFTR